MVFLTPTRFVHALERTRPAGMSEAHRAARIVVPGQVAVPEGEPDLLVPGCSGPSGSRRRL